MLENRRLQYSLLADGSSDRCLLVIIDWVISNLPLPYDLTTTPQWVDLHKLKSPPRQLDDKVREAMKEYPCDILFVHRDAEKADLAASRFDEIRTAVASAGCGVFVPIVPVRMTEAWLLIDKNAVRKAADYPNGTMPLEMPRAGRLHTLGDPKQILEDVLIQASGKRGRKLEQFKKEFGHRRQRVAQYIYDYSALRQLDAFNAFEENTQAAVESWMAKRS